MCRAGTVLSGHLTNVPSGRSAVVRNVSLYYPNSRGFFGLKTRKNSQVFNPLNLSPVMSPLRHRSVFGAKSAENGELRKVRFSCPASNVLPGPPNSLVFRGKPAPGVRRAPKSVFCPEKPANSSPLSLSPPKSPVSNTSACRGTEQSQPVSDTAAREDQARSPTARRDTAAR